MWNKQLIRETQRRLNRRSLPLRVKFWDGSVYVPQVPERLAITLNRPSAVRALAAPSMGRLARAYVEDEFDVDGDIRDILAVGEQLCDAQAAADERSSALLSRIRRSLLSDRANIGFHYDVSNDFFALWLDSRRIYSCAYFRYPEDSLETAQEQKLDLICRKLMLSPGERFLDIGCGWGGLIFWAAEHYDVRSLGITLSTEQYQYVTEEIARRGLQGRVEVRLLDYREVPEDEPFDKIASVGMFEHVGRHNLDRYFGKMYRLLKPGGLAMNHGITTAGVDTSGLRSGISEFIDQYVFPGGELVHVSRVIETMSRAGLECVDAESLRTHYARTLWHWVDRLEASAAEARQLVGEKKFRIWRIYMAGSAHAFTRGWLSLWQIVVGRPFPDGRLPYPYTRNHIYT
jgi:cyclopropane-fatty-acyl-phospholipid synthase